MLILLSIAVALAAFFAVMLLLDPQRKRTVIAAAVVAGAAGAANGLPTVGGPAYADDDDDEVTCNPYAGHGPWVGPGVGEPCVFEDDGPPDLISIGPGQPTGNPNRDPRDGGGRSVTCSDMVDLLTGESLIVGLGALFLPPPASIVLGSAALGLGIAAVVVQTQVCAP